LLKHFASSKSSVSKKNQVCGSIKYPYIPCKGELGVGVETYWGTILDYSGTRQLPLKGLSNIADKFGIVFEASTPKKFIRI